MRVVLDTNVLISAFITRGVCSDLLERCATQHTLVTSPFILDEFHDKITSKFKYSEEDATRAIQLLRSRMEIAIPEDFPLNVCRDPDDDMILATAIAGNASCIVTGDPDLTDLRYFLNIAILKPAEFATYEASKQTQCPPS